MDHSPDWHFKFITYIFAAKMTICLGTLVPNSAKSYIMHACIKKGGRLEN